ncbi:MAG TPA: flagellar hook protein FlgE, partial [Anaerolineae bacterium]|nr:flagellar hook protein FlgE [Anaerolineae bacterium]HIQ06164.1 flagellar hook protein FlgE [Anaerolineae bacterium]
FHQTYMDVVANNIANINTVGFKGSRVAFQELLAQVLSTGSGPDANRGGINPVQLGLGLSLGGVDTTFSQGMLQVTGRNSDLAIQGDGFFVFEGLNGNLYSRDGSFDLGVDGSLVSPTTGLRVLGWMADTEGVVDTTQPLSVITLPTGQALAAIPTSTVEFNGNLDSAAAVGDTVETTIQVYDSQGVAHTISLTFEKTDVNEWSWLASTTDADVSIQPAVPSAVTFLADGSYDPSNPAANITLTLTNGADSPQAVNLDLGQLTQLRDEGAVRVSAQDGAAAGSLTDFRISSTGEVVGIFSNGVNKTIGQLALASFVNPAGLLKSGQNTFTPSANSGEANIGRPGEGNRGLVMAGYLEMSNVDLAQQFTNMIAAQRGFQANSRVITASDQMLQDLVNLVR